MNKINIIKLILLLTLLFGAMSAAWAEDRFYIDAVNIEPGETKTLAFNLDNSQDFYGFQADISLPEGVEIVMTGNKADITLSPRMDASYTVVSNLLSSGAVRLGTFSTSHTPINGNSGALIYLKVSADDSFAGGTISLTDILFIDASDRDVQLPDFSIDLGAVHNNSFYIPDFKISVGETKTVSIILDNETPFTAFQTDIYLPEGLTIETNSFVLSSRAAGTHSVSAKSFSDGRTRIACLSTGNDVFTGNSGELLNFNITADKDVAETCQIELRNKIFSMANAKEYLVPNSTTNVTTVELQDATSGDLNEDGSINTIDLNMMIDHIVSGTLNFKFANGDMNSDSTINSIDLNILIDKIINGN
ncbi:MAG: dockerin type I repeat-containing protein [Muribaculaceae bacterium]|nr:dockerin type I repeat-containing protein [Muribaculaceae bacterium]